MMAVSYGKPSSSDTENPEDESLLVHVNGDPAYYSQLAHTVLFQRNLISKMTTIETK